jgi:hypothetical protein
VPCGGIRWPVDRENLFILVRACSNIYKMMVLFILDFALPMGKVGRGWGAVRDAANPS